jgi:hypothetical protein
MLLCRLIQSSHGSVAGYQVLPHFDNILTTFWQHFDNILTTFWQHCYQDNAVTAIHALLNALARGGLERRALTVPRRLLTVLRRLKI